MIQVNNFNIELKHFPDGTLLLNDTNFKFPEHDFYNHPVIIKWNYESDEECMALWFITKQLKEQLPKITPLFLEMYYIPNARMDRVKSENEVFTLKYFAEFINALEFDRVFVLDPHSNVSQALINKICILDVKYYIDKAISDVAKKGGCNPKDVILYFPDEGAMKRYSSMFSQNRYMFGQKIRDWESGEIKDLKIENAELLEKNYMFPILMIDDIVSYGGTFYHSALKLKEIYNELFICAYATHAEDSVEKGNFATLLDNHTVNTLYTTDSLYKGSYKNIKVIKFNYNII